MAYAKCYYLENPLYDRIKEMNITELVYLTSDVFEILLPRDSRIFHYYDQCVYFIYNLSFSLSKSALYCIISFAHEIISFLLTLLSLILIISLVSFIKSIQPRYKLSNVDNESSSVYKCSSNFNQSLPKCETSSKDRIFPESKAESKLNHKVNSNQVNNQPQSVLKKLFNKFKEESHRINQICHPALTNINIQSIQHQLSWSYSQPDMENLSWLNQTLQTLWPSIRTLLYKFCLIDLIQPRKCETVVKNIKKIDTKKEQSKMSVYISSRRKFDFLRRAQSFRTPPKYNKFLKRSVLTLITYFIKLFLIYTKQFVMDNIVHIFRHSAESTSVTNIQRLELDLNSLMSKISSGKMSLNEQADSKSWAGFGLKSGHRDEPVMVKRKAKSASQETMRNQSKKVFYRTTTTLVKPTNSTEVWRKYKKLMRKFVLAQKKIKRKCTSIDRIRLGDSIPTVNAIKYLDGNNDLHIESNPNLLHSLASDDHNMRFMIELSFGSDKHFEFQASSIPVLGRVRVISVSFQLRFLVTLNHTVTKLNGKNLEIFETPDDVLFPVINHIQLTLIDVPRLDWYLVRAPKKHQKSSDKVLSNEHRDKLKSLMLHADQYLDPIHLLNNSYFKFITHSIIYLVLKWFQPFEVKLSPNLYVKTTC